MKRKTLEERQAKSLWADAWYPASGLSREKWEKYRKSVMSGTLSIDVVPDKTLKDPPPPPDFNESWQAKADSWALCWPKFNTVLDSTGTAHLTCSTDVLIVQGKRMSPACWLMWVHGKITTAQALKWGAKTTFTPEGARKATPYVVPFTYPCSMPDGQVCVDPRHSSIHLPDEVPVTPKFELGDFLNNKPEPRKPRVHIEVDLPPGVEPKDEPASATDPLPAHKSYSVLREKVPPNEWTVFMTAPVEPKNPEEPTDYELDRMEAWADQELYRKGAYDDTKFIERVFAKMAKM